MEGIEWSAFDLPNVQLYSTQLKPEVMDYLWERVEQAKIDDQNCNKHLAGNISKSLTLEDKSSTLGDNYFLNAVFVEIVVQSLWQVFGRHTLHRQTSREVRGSAS